MRRPVRVKWVLLFFRWTRFFPLPSRHCRHPSIRTLNERFSFARFKLVPEHAQWLKIRNQQYSQWAGREELFERERDSNSDFHVWDGCALASEKVANEESRQRNVRSAEYRSFFDRSRSRSTPEGVR